MHPLCPPGEGYIHDGSSGADVESPKEDWLRPCVCRSLSTFSPNPIHLETSAIRERS
jgi:hypothetical protein